MKSSDQPPPIFYRAFGGVSFLLLGIAAVLFYFDQRAANQFTTVEGIVIRNQFNGKMARPVISYQWEGKELLHFSSTYTNPPAFERGEKVELFVNPNDPNDVRINSFIGRFLSMLIVGAIGLVFLGFLVLFHYAFQ